jgi:tetratricopeptide (TPR) repeat protein
MRLPRLLFLILTGPLLFIVLTSAPALSDDVSPSQDADGQSLLQAGVGAFERGDLEQARLLLEQARASGLESFALHYNLGVLYYRAGRYALSRQAFRELLGTRHDDLARYNLGLVAQAAGRDPEALEWFRQVAASSEQQKLQRLAERQLQGRAERSAPAEWLGFASLSGGYESNLALRPESVASGLSDGFSDVLVAGQGPVLDLGGNAGSAKNLQLSASLYRRHYHGESEFSTDAARLGLSWVSRGTTEKHEIGLRQSYFRSGGEPREMHTSLLMEYRRAACVPGRFDGRCQLSLIASRVRPFDRFEAYQGMRYLAQASYRHSWSRWQASGRLGMEFNNRKDIAEGGQFISLSPRRQQIGLGLTYKGWAAWSVGGELGYRYSDYPDAYQLETGPDWESGRRTEHRYTIELTAEYLLSRAWTVTGSSGYHSNDSSLKQYDYDNQIYQLGIDYLF